MSASGTGSAAETAASCARDRLALGVFRASQSEVRLTNVKEWPEPGELFESVAKLLRDRMSQGKPPGSPVNATGDPASQARLVAALVDPAVFGPGCKGVRHLETHISHVLLTGALRLQDQEAGRPRVPRLHARSRSASATASRSCASIAGSRRRSISTSSRSPAASTVRSSAVTGPSLEYAVKMREFPQDALASRHARARRAHRRPRRRAGRAGRRIPRSRRDGRASGTRFGSPDTILRVALQNFDADPPAATTIRQTARRWMRCARGPSASTRAAARSFARAQGGRLRARMPRRPPSRQHRGHRRRGHRLRLHRVQRRAALDRRDERNRVHDDGSRGPRAAGPRAPVPQRLSRDHRRLRGTGGVSVLPRLPRDGAGEDRVPAVGPAARRATRERRSPPNTAATSISPAHYARAPHPAIVDHARSVRLRQDHADAGAARAGPARSAFAPTSSASGCTALDARARSGSAARTRACTLPMRPSAPTAARWSSPKRSRRRVASRSSTARSSSAGSAISSVPARRSSGSRS